MQDTLLYSDLDADLPEADKQPSRLKKLLIALMGALVLLMFVFYFILAPVSSEIRGKLSSLHPEDGKLVFANKEIIFTGNTQEFLANIYIANQELRAVETSACLKGLKENNRYIISEVFQPVILQQQFNHVTFESCPSDTLVMLHTHPYLHCEASTTDHDTFDNRKKQNEDLLMVIMCAPKSYVVYG